MIVLLCMRIPAGGNKDIYNGYDGGAPSSAIIFHLRKSSICYMIMKLTIMSNEKCCTMLFNIFIVWNAMHLNFGMTRPIMTDITYDMTIIHAKYSSGFELFNTLRPRQNGRHCAEPMMVRLATYISVIRPQWVKDTAYYTSICTERLINF